MPQRKTFVGSFSWLKQIAMLIRIKIYPLKKIIPHFTMTG